MFVIANNQAMSQSGNAMKMLIWPELKDTDGNLIAYFFENEAEISMWGREREYRDL